MPGPGSKRRWESPVSEPRDGLDAWLTADVEPLLPPPGAFGRISRRARQRRRNQVLMSCAAGVAVIAVAAAVPQVISALRPGHAPSGPPPAASQSRTVTTPAPSASPSASSLPSGVSPSPPGQQSWTVPTGRAVPANFQPLSITLVGPAVAAVLGNNMCRPGASRCISLAATVSEGSSWYGLTAAPAAGPADGSAGVSQLRFLNTQVGWAFGPALYATVDGGASWVAEPVPGGQRVLSLETAGDHAFALVARCTGAGGWYSADCTRFSLYTSSAGSMSWQAVAVPAGYRSMTAAGSGGAASLVLASGTLANPDAGAGYLLTPSGALLSGNLTGGPWRVIGQIPRACRIGGSLPNGQPEGAQLASGSLPTTPQLVLSCDGPAVARPAVASQAKAIYTSPDGTQWTRTGTAPGGGTAYSLAAASGGLIVLATNTGIDYSADSGASWHAAGLTSPPAGFSYVGMTTQTDGVAVPNDAGLGEVFITRDGGQTWLPSPVHGG
jgi:hypothetical protein